MPPNFLGYFAVGGIAAVVDIGGFVALSRSFGIAWFWAALASFVAAVAVNYVLSVRFVFKSGVHFSRHLEIAVVVAVSAIGLGLNEAILWALIEQAGWDGLPAKLIATAAVFFWNYEARESFIFRAPCPDERAL